MPAPTLTVPAKPRQSFRRRGGLGVSAAGRTRKACGVEEASHSRVPAKSVMAKVLASSHRHSREGGVFDPAGKKLGLACDFAFGSRLRGKRRRGGTRPHMGSSTLARLFAPVTQILHSKLIPNGEPWERCAVSNLSTARHKVRRKKWVSLADFLAVRWGRNGNRGQ